MCGYIFYWCDYFGFSVNKAQYRNKYDKIRAFMKANCDKMVHKADLESLFSEFTSIKPQTRIVTYNKFMENNLIFYKIVKKVVKDGNTRKNKWFVSSMHR